MLSVAKLGLLLSLAVVCCQAGDWGGDADGWGRYCNPNTQFFQNRNGFQVRSAGNWSQSISYLIPGFVPGQETNPGAFCYAGSAKYYQTNYYDRPSCGFVSIQAWPNCVGPISLANFPNGVYLQTVQQDIIIPDCSSELQQYDVYYLTPAVPIVPAQNTNAWTSVAVDPYLLANVVHQKTPSGQVTSEVVYAETIFSTKDTFPKQRIYLPGTVSGTTLTAIAPFYSNEIANLPAPYDAMVSQYRNGQVRLSYFSSCDGYNWALSNCRQCGSGSRTQCAACPGGAPLQCVSSYYLPFPAGNNPCEN